MDLMLDLRLGSPLGGAGIPPGFQAGLTVGTDGADLRGYDDAFGDLNPKDIPAIDDAVDHITVDVVTGLISLGVEDLDPAVIEFDLVIEGAPITPRLTWDGSAYTFTETPGAGSLGEYLDQNIGVLLGVSLLNPQGGWLDFRVWLDTNTWDDDA